LKLPASIIIVFILISIHFGQVDSLKLSYPKIESLTKQPSVQDSLFNLVLQHPEIIDSLKLRIKAIVISGNKVTHDDVILREMVLKQGSIFSIEDYLQSMLNIYNLRLFTKVDIIPIPVSKKDLVLNVDVQEMWYIFPLPQAGMYDGEWSKKWVGLNFYWNNFRGRNELLFLQFRALYNPSISGLYSVPWIGNNLHLAASVGAGYSDTKNQSLSALGRNNGTHTLSTSDSNFENINFYSQLSLSKFITRRLSIYTDFSFNYVRVTQYNVGRTISPNGKDKYLGLGFGISFDSRNLLEYSTMGHYLNLGFLRYGYIDNDINYGQFAFESQNFIPLNLSKEFFISIASRVYTSLSVGTMVPDYNHVYLGYGDDYVRGWLKRAFEGNDKLTFYNEIRIPVLTPRYTNANKLPILKSLPYVNNYNLKYGLYFTVLYDLGSVWNNNQRLNNVKFISGAGIGLNAVLPFGYVARLEWAFPIIHHPVGQVVFTLNSKF
jgi:outer membrane protein assembly factor BamA